MEGDKTKLEVKLLDQEVSLLKDKILVLDSILGKKDKTIINYEQIVGTKDEQLVTYFELNKRLQSDLKKQKAKTKIFQLGSSVAIAGLLVITIL